MEGCLEEVGIFDGGPREEGVLWFREGLAGWAVEVRHIYVDVRVSPGGRVWSWRYQVVSWARAGWSQCFTGVRCVGVLWLAFFWGALVSFSRPVHRNGVRVWGVR